jgi:D-beta-D-heptose 7-phosphate kinase/D-beta-D-heptose 1-phosphate adenosyltransferase
MKIFVNGSFDILHKGHLGMLETAKSLGDFLLVAIDSDRRIAELKGSDRPFNNQENRVALMAALKWVDKVKVFDSDDELINIMRQYEPDITLKGSDWFGKRIVGHEYAGNIIFYDRIDDESTTNTIERFIARRHLHR